MLDKKIFKKIEYHLYNYESLLEQYNDEIGLSSKPPDGMPHGTDLSDTTADKALKLDIIYSWIVSIEQLIKKYDEEGKTYYIDLINKRYRQNKRPWEIASEMHCDRRTIYRWREEIITDLALKAATKGLVGF